MPGLQIHRCVVVVLGALIGTIVQASSPLAAVVFAPSQPSGPSPSRDHQLTVDQLIDALGSPHYRERQRATEILKSKDQAFAEELKRIYGTVQDHETQLRLREVAEFLFYRDALHDLGGFLGIEMGPNNVAIPGGINDPVLGVQIKRIIQNTGADRGGLRAGDIILQINGRNVFGDASLRINDAFRRAVSSLPPGDEIRLTIRRNDSRLVKWVTLGLKPLSLVRQHVELGDLTTDQQIRIESAGQEFDQWCAELADAP